MPATLTSTQPGSSANYYRYIYGDPVVKTDNISDVDTLDFTLAPSDANFVKLNRGSYVIAQSDLYPNWFTGYIGNDPEYTYLGTDKVTGKNRYSLKYQAQSDEILLSQQSLGIIPPFINMTQGQILKTLIDRLLPGKFDTSGIADGLFLSRYVVDPTKKFSDIVKDFTDAAVYRLWSRNHVVYFQPQDVSTEDAPTTIVDAHDKHFTPANLDIRATKMGITNEAIVLGGVEPQAQVTEFFVGDASTALFPLMTSVYGVESTLYLDEDFSETAFDTSKWTVYDKPDQFLQISNGYLNVLGGSINSSFDVHLDSALLVPLSGAVRFTHGDIDFLNPSGPDGDLGIIGGIWTQAPNSSFTGCVYGLLVHKGAGNLTLHPICNGALTGDSMPINTAKRYVMRTLLSTSRVKRVQTQYSGLTPAGIISMFTPATDDVVPETLNFITWVSEIDPTTGTLDSGFPKPFLASMTSQMNEDAFGTYISVASNNLHATLTNVTVDTPLQCTLELKGAGGGYQQAIVGQNEVDALDGLAPVATITQSGGVSRSTSILGSPKYSIADPTLAFFKNSTAQTTTIPNIGARMKLTYREAGTAVGRVRDLSSIATEASNWGDSGVRSVTRSDLSPLPATSAECEAAAAAIVVESATTRYEGTYTISSIGIAGEPSAGTAIQFQNMPTDTFVSSSFAELIYSVKSTLMSVSPKEYYEHEISFGKATDQLIVKKFLSAVGSQTDVFTPSDSIEMPMYVEPDTIQDSYGPDALGLDLVSLTASTINMTLGQAVPAGCQMEVRSTDAGWGSADGSNLITRTTSQTFSVPRNSRNKSMFVRLVNTSTGKYSRYSAAARVNYPMVPPPPGATLTFVDASDPVVSLTLPEIAIDVWGYEVRAADNTTVLEHQAIADSGIAPNLAMPQIHSRTPTYYAYTYNLLGEYSEPVALTFTLPTPTISTIEVDNRTKMLVWDSTNSTGFELRIDDTDNTFTHLVVNQLVTGNYFSLSDPDFFYQRWIKIIPYDDLGEGSPASTEHVYIPTPVDELAANEVVVIADPQSSGVTVPSNFAKYSADYTSLAYQTYIQNMS